MEEEKLINIYNEDCFVTMERLAEQNKKVDMILTSPFYNTNKKSGGNVLKFDKLGNPTNWRQCRYDVHSDNLTNDEYCDFTINLFNHFDKILVENGVILYNISYGCENPDGLYLALSSIIASTNFQISDMVVWKKKSALPINLSPNKLTRICEPVFVICRKDEYETYKSSKSVVSVRNTGQKMYSPLFNFVEEKNND